MAYSQIYIDTSFEGSNARILSINTSTNTVKIESKLRTGDVHNVVFYCRIWGFNTAAPLKIQVKYTQQYYLPVLAAYSYDNVNWTRYTGTIVGDSKEFTRTFSQSPVYFCYVVSYTDDISRLRNFKTATLLVKGTGSSPWLHKVIDLLGSNLPNSRIVEFPGGHAPHIVSIDKFLQELERFLSGE